MNMRLIYQGLRDVYELNNEEIVKLFPISFDEAKIEQEFHNGLLINMTSIKSAEVRGKIDINGRIGIKYEKLVGSTMADLVKNKPWLIVKYAKRFAELNVAIHSCECPGLPRTKSRFKMKIDKKNIKAEEKGKLLELLNELPDGDCVCHNDFHLGNIMVCQDGEYIIDWANATIGDPSMEVAVIMNSLKFRDSVSNSTIKEHFRNIYWHLFSMIYLRQYLKLTGAKLQEINKWQEFLKSANLKSAK